jgi:hypothetical protein
MFNMTLSKNPVISAQAVKATGFNHGGHREHRVFKPILCVPLCSLWLYFIPRSFMSVAVLCTQLTITKSPQLTRAGTGGYI